MCDTKFILAVEFDFSDRGLERARQDPEVEVRVLSGIQGPAIPPECLEGVDAFISGGRQVNAASLARADRLQWVGRFGAGYDNLHVDDCTQKGVLVSNAPQGVWDPVAELTVSLVLALAYRLKPMDQSVRRRGFSGRHRFRNTCLNNRVLGLIGCGGIGQRVVELLNPFQVTVLAHDPYADQERLRDLGVEPTSLGDLLDRSDLVSLHVPLTAETRGMLTADHFRRMKDTACLINTSRGGIYKDATLALALNEGWIAGAGIDVYEDENDVEHNPLQDTGGNVILTPHAAGGLNEDGMRRVGETLVQSALNIKEGTWPLNILNPKARPEEIPAEYLSPSFIPKRS